MKKIIALMLVLMFVLFAGCTSEKATEEKEEHKEKKESSYRIDEEELPEDEENESKPAKKEPEEPKKESPEEAVRDEIDERWLALVGKTQEEIVRIKGEMSENLWADGPLYRFGPENVWYSFDSYDFAADNSYIPLGRCTGVGVPLDMLLENEESCDARALQRAVKGELIQGFDAMYECNTYTVTYKGFRFLIYEDSASAISGQSVVDIERE